MDSRAYATAYAALGWPVFPLIAGKKIPATSHGFEDATTDPQAIAAFPAGCNLGLRCGVRFWVLDIDCKPGIDGELSLEALQREYGALPQTLTARTRNGGRHLLFQHVPGMKSKTDVFKAQGWPGIDTRAEGGYIVAEPSEVPADMPGGSGAYIWEDWDPISGEAPEIAQAPGWLVGLLMPRSHSETAPEPAHAHELVDLTQEQSDALQRALEALDPDNYEIWIAVGMALYNLQDGFDVWTEWARSSAKFNRQESIAKWGTFKPATATWEHILVRAGVPIPKEIPSVAPVRPVIERVDLSNLASSMPPEPKFWVHGIVPAGTVTLLGAHGGTGKSTLALTLGACVACEVPFNGLPVGPARVAYLSLEDSRNVVLLRLRKICDAYALPIATVIENLTILDGSEAGALAEEWNNLGNRGMRGTPALHLLAELVENVDLLFIDNASDALDANENERRTVRWFVRQLEKLVKAHGGSVVLLAHVAKENARFGGRESYSGSTAWHNSARSRLGMAVEPDGRVRLDHLKSNLGKMIPPLYFAWSDNGVLVPSEAPATASAGDLSAQAVRDDAAVFEAIAKAESADAHIPTALQGSHTAIHVLSEMAPSLAKQKRRIKSALIRLEHAKRIFRVMMGTSSRHQRERWCTAPIRQFAPIPDIDAISADGEAPLRQFANSAMGGVGGIGAHRTAVDSGQAGAA